jgi:hypothetical protein
MINTLRHIVLVPFWNEWENRFEGNTAKFITPNIEPVKKYAAEVNSPKEASDKQIAKEIWLHITNNTLYRLSKKWKTPKETIESGSADCEDMVFLFTSVAPNLGLYEVVVVIGYLHKDGVNYPHVWAEVEGMVIDPTGYPEDVDQLGYEDVETFEIRFD